MSQPVAGSKAEKTMNRPSRDQSVGIFALGVRSSTASLPGAVTTCRNRFGEPPRNEAKTISSPVGAHTG